MKLSEDKQERFVLTSVFALVASVVLMTLLPIRETATLAAETNQAAKTTSVDEYQSPDKVISSGGDWPQWGGTRFRNNVPEATDLVQAWNIGKFDRRSGDWDKTKAENIKWFSRLGSQTYGNPVVADGHVYVGTNNGGGHLKRYPANVDLGCLLAFDESNGDFLWQHSSEKLITGRVHDWPLQGICCAPLVEGDRLWFVTSRGEVRCLDTKGFHDDEDDGPVKNEAANVTSIMDAGPAAADFEKTLEALGDEKLSAAAMKALAEAGEPVDGDIKVETIVKDKSWKATGQLWRR